LQTQFETKQAELQSQRDQELRRRDAALSEVTQREQELAAKLAAHTEAHQAAKKEWESQLEKTRQTIEPIRTLLARAEKERDEAVQSASESHRQFQDIRKKSLEAFSLLNGWRNGDHAMNGNGNGNGRG
jgi:chromosome segregation ATPase